MQNPDGTSAWTLGSVAVAGVVALLAVAGIGAGAFVGGSDAGKGFQVRTVVLDEPVRVWPIRQPSTPHRESGVEWFQPGTHVVPVKSESVLSPSTCIHLVKCFGGGVKLSIAGQEHDALSVLLDQDLSLRYFGHYSVVKTRTGARFPTMSQTGYGTLGDESHRDQCLASLAEFGIPLSTPLRVDGQEFTLLNVLEDSVANFHIEQSELEWSVVAYAMYMPSPTGWANRFGESFTFDQCAREMMNRPIESASCGGTHRFMSLTFLLRIDSQTRIFCEEVREEVSDFLQRALACAGQNQGADGAWEIGWNRTLFSTTAEADSNGGDQKFGEPGRLIMTGHIAEWLLYLPDSFDVDPGIFRRSGQWLSVRLNDVSEEELWKGICPYTHAFCAVKEPPSTH